MGTACRALTVLALVGLLGFPLAGCSKAAEDTAEKAAEEAMEEATGGEVDIEDDGDSVTITTEGEDGESVTISGGDTAEVPDSFPDDFPLYKGDVVGSSSLTSGEGSMVTVSVETDDDPDDIKAYFEDQLDAKGWNILFQSDVSQDGQTAMNYTVEKGGRNGSVGIVSDDGVITVTHTVLAEE
jgi:hypothetical protein